MLGAFEGNPGGLSDFVVFSRMMSLRGSDSDRGNLKARDRHALLRKAHDDRFRVNMQGSLASRLCGNDIGPCRSRTLTAMNRPRGGLLQEQWKAHQSATGRPPSTAVDCGKSEKVSERSKIASSFRAAGRDAYRDVGGRATQEAKAEECREPEGWRPGRSSPSRRRGICASMHGRANGFGDFYRNSL
jgi:hypothetical protein